MIFQPLLYLHLLSWCSSVTLSFLRVWGAFVSEKLVYKVVFEEQV